MKNFMPLMALMMAAGLFVACGKKKTHTVDNIIVPPKEVNVPDTTIHKMNVTQGVDSIKWLGTSYCVNVKRTTSDSLTYIIDNTGKRYRNNSIEVKITRKDGSVFFEKKFTKNAFESFLENEYFQHSVLLGMVYNGTEKDEIRFLGSVGSPDDLAEEFVPFNVFVSKMGEVRIEKAVLDIPNDSTEISGNEGV